MDDPKESPIAKGPLRALRAFRYSLAGLGAAWRHEEAFRQEVIVIAIFFPLALWLGENGVERALLTGSLLIVLIVEILNSAVENVVDRHGKDFHILAKRAKDLGAAAVLLALLNSTLVWGLVLLG